MKTVIITGGTSGIGLNLANFFYNRNFNVAIAGLANKSTINNLKKKFMINKSLILKVDKIGGDTQIHNKFGVTIDGGVQ